MGRKQYPELKQVCEQLALYVGEGTKSLPEDIEQFLSLVRRKLSHAVRQNCKLQISPAL
jgi:hypothetical protein